jgi:hypothetical protein
MIDWFHDGMDLLPQARVAGKLASPRANAPLVSFMVIARGLCDEALMDEREYWTVKVDVDGQRMEETKQY